MAQQDANTNGDEFETTMTIDRLWEDVEDGYTDRRVLSVEGVMDVAEHEAHEMAAGDAPTDFCAMCVENTPLAYENASDIHVIKRVEALVATTSQVVLAIENGVLVGEIDARHHPDVDWVYSAVTDAYQDGYFEACADPTDCDVCVYERDADCGHLENGDACPAR